VTGDSATAEVEGATQTAKLAKVEGDWKISELDFGDAAASAPPAEEPPPEEEPPPAAEEGGGEETALIQGRLEGAGYSVEVNEPEGNEPVPQGELPVDLKDGANLTVSVYASPDEAQETEATFASLLEEQAGRVRVRVEGANLYVGT